MWQHPLSAGGFLWCFSDEGIVRRDKNDSLDTDGSHAPDGIVGPYREKEGSFYTIKQIWSPVYVEPFHITPTFTGQITLENRYHYTNLNQCQFGWSLVTFPAPSAAAGAGTAAGNTNPGGRLPPWGLAPGGKGHLKLPLPAGWQTADALRLTATDPHGREIYTWVFPVKRPAQLAAALTAAGGRTGKVTAAEDVDFITLTAHGIAVKFDKKTGLLAGANNGKSAISLTNGPVLAPGTARFENLRHYADGNDYVVEVNYQGALRPVRWRMLPGGWLRLDYRYQVKGTVDFAGVNFDYPEAKITGMRWLGDGPYRVWKNRTKGVELGVWEKKYNDTRTGETWQYPEFRGYHSDLYWAIIQTTEAPITVVSATENLYLRMLTPTRQQGAGNNNNTAPPFPSGTISFLHAIPAIGTKFTPPAASGPASAQNQFSPLQPEPEATLYFFFGDPF